MSYQKQLLDECDRVFLGYHYRFDRRIKVCLISSMAWGLFSHGMVFLNKYSFHDDAHGLFSIGATFKSGRWFLDVLGQLSNLIWGGYHYSLPLFNGLFSLFCIAISSCLIINLLQIRNLGIIVAVSCIMTSFPMLAALFGYMFTAPYYTIAILLISLGNWIYSKNKCWYTFFIAGVLFCCATGIYQAFFPAAITLLLLCFIKEVGDSRNNKWSEFFLRGLYLMLLCLFSMVLYLIINWIWLAVKQVELSDYMGINTMGNDGLLTYFQRSLYAYQYFFNPVELNGSNSMFPLHTMTLYRLTLILGVILIAWKLYIKAQKSKIGAVQMLLLITGLPLSVNFIFVMCKPGFVHNLMVYAEVFIFVFFAWLIDDVVIENKGMLRAVRSVALAIIFMLPIMYARYDNIVYLKTEFAQKEAINFFSSLIAQIKSVDGYKDEYPVVFLNVGSIQDANIPELQEWSVINTCPIHSGVKSIINSYSWIDFLSNWCAFCPVYGDANTFENLPEVMSMSSYPDFGSIKIIDNTVVVKF